MNIHELILNGKLKEIPFGIKRSELINIMGETEYTVKRFRKDKVPSIYKYEEVEFYFGDPVSGNLEGIMIQLFTNKATKGSLELIHPEFGLNPTYSEIVEYLNINNISYTKDVLENAINLSNKVFFAFEGLNECSKLIKYGLFLEVNS